MTHAHAHQPRHHYILRSLLLASVLIGLTFGNLYHTQLSQQPTTPPTRAPVTAIVVIPLTPTAAPTATFTATPTRAPTDTPRATDTPYPTPTPSMTPTPTAQPVVPPELWATPTPFTAYTTISGTLVPVTPVPTSVPALTPGPDVVNILLLGSDHQPRDGTAWRTDTIIVASLDPNNGVVSLLSLPRDTFVYVPGYSMDRINTVDRRGGPELMRQTILYNFGIPVHFYARIDFDNFKRIVNAVGGVDVPVDCQLVDWRLKSPELDQTIPANWGMYTQTVGIQHMDGDLALWYARSRITTNDFDRGRRQQKILRELYHTARDQNMLTRIPDLWNAFHDAVQTDLGLGDLLWLARIAAPDKDVRLRSFQLGTTLTNWTTPAGAQVLLPNWGRMQPILRAFLTAPAANHAVQDRFTVELWNGTLRPDIERLASDRLRLEEYVVSIAPADGQVYTQTTIIDFTGVTKGSKIPRLREIFNVPAERVLTQVDPASPIKYRVILGNDYDSCRGARNSSSYVASTPTPVPTITPGPSPTPTIIASPAVSGTPSPTLTLAPTTELSPTMTLMPLPPDLTPIPTAAP